MWGQFPTIASIVVLSILLIWGAVSDLKGRRIPNLLNLAIALTAPLGWWAMGLTFWPGIGLQFAVALAVFLPLFLMFALNAMGGGDVKMLTALALWVAPRLVMPMLLVMAVVGGLLAAAMLVHYRLTAPDDDDVTEAPTRPAPEVPYGVAIAVAGLWAVHQQYINHLMAITPN
jgi:prepilin peptidase CpaA